jgi:hypothetical protein
MTCDYCSSPTLTNVIFNGNSVIAKLEEMQQKFDQGTIHGALIPATGCLRRRR